MSKHLVWTVNINNHMSANARESIMAAADRWGCDYLEVRTIFDRRLYPSFAKVTSIEKILCYERAVYFDSDMLIHIDAPSPFEVFDDPSKFVCALDIHPENHDPNSEQWTEVKNNVQAYYWEVLEYHLGWGVPKERFMDNFFNSGFFVCSPKRHKTIFRAIESALPLSGGRENFSWSAHYEQALFNYALQAYRPNDQLLAGECWNRLEPPISEPVMTDYVWHFTGFYFHVHKHTVSSYDWRAQ